MIRFRGSFNDITAIKKATHGVIGESRKQSKELPKFASREFAAYIITSIFKQTYRSDVPYSNRYEKWKLKHVKHLEQWRLEDFLVKSIYSSKISSTQYFAGIRSGILATHTVGRNKPQTKEIAFYAAINESIRPLFEPGLNDYSEKQFPKLMEIAEVKIKSRWKK